MKKRNLAIALGGAGILAVAVTIARRAKTVEWDDVASLVPHSDKSHFVNVDGARVHYQEFGDAADPTLLLVHGYTASVYVWKTVAPMLAERGFHVVAVDLLGFGYSEKPISFDYTIASQARMVSRFMERIGIATATLVGSSYGGAVAATIALDEPGRVEKLVFVDAVINDEATRHPLLRLAKLRGVGEVLTPLLARSPRFFRMRMRATLAKSNHHLITRERLAAVRRPLNAADGHRSVLATSRAWDAQRIQRDAHLISQPTLILWGDRDQVIKIHNGYKLHQEIEGSRFVIFKDCGHVPQEEKSEPFAEVVSDFCKNAALKSIDSVR